MTALATAPRRTDVEIITFGCRLNTYESEVVKNLAREGRATDTVIVNTCAVTSEAERQARQAIRGARRRRPHSRIVVTGCAAQIAPERFAAMAEVDVVLGNIEKLDAEIYRGALAEDEPPKVLVNDIMRARETAAHLVSSFEGRARAFVEVQQGCDHRCTFCIIPFGRGPSRSVPVGEIVAQTRALVENGYREVVLTGVDLSSFGGDLPGKPTLGQMVRRLLRLVPELPRIRLSSIDPAEVDDDLLRLFAEEPRLMPHLHLSLQSGDDMILKRMKRRHARADAVKLCAELRRLRPDIVFGADLIAGFPTETEAMFENTLAVVEDCGLTWLHVFPYSPRPGTPAARMPQVGRRTAKARAARLREAGAKAVARHLDSRVGTLADVLMERADFGRTEHFAPVRITRTAAPGEIVPLTLSAASGGEFLA